MRRAAGEAWAGSPPSDLFGTEDHDLWLRILESGHRAVVNPKPLAVYRIVEGSVSDSLLGMARTSQRTFQRALERGNLTPLQRAVARRSCRVQFAVERWEQFAAARAREGRLPLGELLRAAPLLGLVVLEHPNRWARWARILVALRRGEALPSR